MALATKLGLFTIEILDTDFDDVITIADYSSLNLTIGINQIGAMSLVVRDDHPLVAAIDERYYCNVNYAIGTNDDDIFQGFLERSSYSVSNGRKFYTYVFSGLLSVLQQGVIAWLAGTDNRSDFDAEDIHDIIHNVISYNFFNGTTANGRERTSDNSHVQSLIASLSGPGAPINISIGVAWRNVYDVVMQLLDASDFEIVPKLDTTFNRITFELDYDGIGADKTDEIWLSETWGTIISYDVVKLRSDFKNVAIVGGSGQGDNRNIVIRTSADYSTSVRNAEMFVDARQITATSGLETAGDSALVQSKQKTRYNADVSSMLRLRLRPDRTSGFWLGDTVNLMTDNAEKTVRVISLNFEHGEGQNKARLVLEDA